MNISFSELKTIEAEAFAAGIDAAMAEVDRVLPDMLLCAVKKEVELQMSNKPKRPAGNASRPARSSKPYLRAVS